MIAMRLPIRHLLLALTALPIVCVGCSASRQSLANHDSASTPIVLADDAPPSDAMEASELSDAPSTIQPVAFHDDDSDDSDVTDEMDDIDDREKKDLDDDEMDQDTDDIDEEDEEGDEENEEEEEDTDEQSDDSDDVSVQLSIPVPIEDFIMGEAGLTLEAIEQLAFANNPAIQQASSASARAGGIRTQVGLKPNPTVGYFGQEIGNEGAGGQHGAFVSQTFVRGDKLAWNREVIGHDVNAMNWQVETQRQRVRTDIQLAFYDALAAQKRLQLASEFRNVAKEGVTVSEERVDAKVGTRTDVLQSEIQLNEVDLSIAQAQFESSAALNELAALAGVSSLGTTTLIGDLDAAFGARDAEAEFSQIVAMSPQLAAAQARVDRARANLQRQKVQPISNITAQLGVGGDAATGNAFTNLQLSLPVPIHNKNQGNIRAALAESCAATQNVQRLRQSIRRDLARVMQEYHIADATVRQYRDSILPKADETLQLIKEAQEAGEFDFLRVLTARRSYFDANLKYVAALGQLAQANAKIDGLLLSGGLSNVVTYGVGDGLRGQALSGE